MQITSDELIKLCQTHGIQQNDSVIQALQSKINSLTESKKESVTPVHHTDGQGTHSHSYPDQSEWPES